MTYVQGGEGAEGCCTRSKFQMSREKMRIIRSDTQHPSAGKGGRPLHSGKAPSPGKPLWPYVCRLSEGVKGVINYFKKFLLSIPFEYICVSPSSLSSKSRLHPLHPLHPSALALATGQLKPGPWPLATGPAGLFRPGGASPVDLSNTTRPCPRRTIFARRCLYLGSIGLSRVIYSLEKFYFEDLKIINMKP